MLSKVAFLGRYFVNIVLLTFTISLFAQKNDYHFSVLKQLELLDNNTVSSFYQSEAGVMWINSNSGLIRFNGNSVKVVAYPLSMKPLVGNKDYVYSSLVAGVLRINIKTNEKEEILQDQIVGEQSHIYVRDKYLYVGEDNCVELYDDTVLYKRITLSGNVKISQLYVASDNTGWVGTQEGVLYQFFNTGQIVSIVSFPSEITALFVDSGGMLWVGTLSNGAYCIDKGKVVERYSSEADQEIRISNNYIRTFCEDRLGQIWMATLDGVNVLNKQKDKIVSFLVGSMKEKSVWALHSDQQGNIWAGTFYSGAYLFNLSAASFNSYPTNDSIVMVNRLIEDKRGDIWVFTDGKGVFRKQRNGKIELVLSSVKKTKSAYYDPAKDAIWIGTHLEGLYCYSIEQNSLQRVLFDDEYMNKNTVTVNDIVSRKNILYIGTTNGVCEINKKNPHRISYISSYRSLVHSLLVDKNEELWIAGIGVYKYNFHDKRTQKVVNSDLSTLPDDTQFKWVFEDHVGRIWISALRYGLVMIDKGKSTIYSDQTIGLGDNFVSTINESNDGVLLLGTNSGFSLLFPERNRCFTYNYYNGFPLRSTRNGAILLHSSGEIFVGGTTGIASLTIDTHDVEQYQSIYFDRLRINNQDVENLKGVSVDGLSLTYTQGLILNHMQKNIAIEVASTDLSHTLNPYYEYCLEGYDTEWTRFALSQPIIYMNLQPGEYTLRVRSYTDGSRAQLLEIMLPITALAPWYATVFAKTLYFILFILFVFSIFYFFYSRLVFREKLRQQEESARAKLHFFTNVSHEIRTPLTLISGHLEMLLSRSKTGSSDAKDVASAFDNTRRMQDLVTELLDFEKQALGYKKLTISKRDFVEFVRHVYSCFQSYADYRAIDFKLNLGQDILILFCDYVQLQKVFFNMLMNAFKYTPNGGSILMEVVIEDVKIQNDQLVGTKLSQRLSSLLLRQKKNNNRRMLVVRVSDTGQGVPAEKLERIFDPFYQDSAHISQDKYNKGTGIGLSIAKNIIEQHHGCIWAKSKVGEGSIFSVALPIGDSWFKNDVRIEVVEGKETLSMPEISSLSIDGMTEGISFKNIDNNAMRSSAKKKILIVEDDEELQNLLHSIFNPLFNVLVASNGSEAFSLAQAEQPDIIVSDVMMPVMDGLEFCAKIKETLSTSHIPVILLTARTTIEQNIEGIRTGADDYINKPFSVELLIAKCNSLLHNREVLIQKYCHSVTTSVDSIVSNVQDACFLEKLVALIENNISSEKLGVPFLSAEMAMGKTLLTLKIKGITNQSPAEFIQTLKMKRAAWMILNEPHKNISDIAYELGFSSPKYFGIRFRKQFGQSPTELRNEL